MANNEFKIGQSTDIHPLKKGRRLMIGGVEIEHYQGLDGHSDADVLTHAIAEAIIGALGKGDLGKHFPDTDDKWKDCDSLGILAEVSEMMQADNYEIGNIDALVIIEKPKLSPYIEKMRGNIAKILDCEVELVNIKATRGEGLGIVGEEKGVIAQAIVLLRGKGK